MSQEKANPDAAPWCQLPIWHPARCHSKTLDNEPARALSSINPLDLVDDYGKVEAQDWLSSPGGFR